MKRKPVLTLYKKEIMDLLRDKKTIIVMILIPIFLYPAMMLGSLLVMQGIVKESESKEYKIAMVESGVSSRVFEILSDEEDKFEYKFKEIPYTDEEKAKEELKEKKVDLVIVSGDYKTSDILTKSDKISELYDTEDLLKVKCYNLSSNTNSSSAYQYVSEILRAYSSNLRKDAFDTLFDDAEGILNPVDLSVESISSSEQNAGSIIGMVLPFILIISILTGAIYPAIDATAGERERGTLETIMTLPVRKSDIMISKFMSVSTIAVFSAFLNLLSMFAMTFYMYKTFDMQNLGFKNFDFKLFIPAFLSLLICLPVFSMFSSAVSLCVCIFAKSFKEANNITSPILIVFMFAAMASILPNVELSSATALIPVSNISLLIKSVFSLDYDYHLMLMVLLSNLVYCILLVVIMSTLFSSEEVLFGEGVNGIHLFENFANQKRGQIPGYGDLLFLYAALLLIMVFTSSMLVLKWGLWGSAGVQAIILVIPLLYALYLKCNIRELYSLNLPKVKEMLGSVCLWIGGFTTNQVILSGLSKLIPSMVENSDSLNSTIFEAGFIPAIIVVGICPAIAEEAAFRGFLFGSLRKRTKIWIAVIVSAAAFGLYHLNFLQFFTGLYLGSIMAYMVYKSRSIFASALFHLLNNSISVILTFHPEILTRIPLIGVENPGIGENLGIAAVGIVFLALGLFLFGAFSKKGTEQL
ncbi:MAG: ABC transporter permease subunit [Lachnospiraceae bacterium]|nr:ABC transporter permease subunit [Lachnospiraceae bacterium]